VRPRRATVAHRLQTNATLEAFEEADLFRQSLRIPVRCSPSTSAIHVKAGEVLAVIDVPK